MLVNLEVTRSLSVELTRDALEGLQSGSDPSDLFAEHSELCTQEAKGVIYDLCAAIDVHRFADRSGGIELRLRCRDGLLEFTIPGIAAPVLATPARVHSPRSAASAEAKQQLECPPVTPSTLRPGPEHALTTRGPSKRKRSR